MAQHFLLNGFSAQDAASESGFHDYSAFYRAYVRVTGHSPSSDKDGVQSQLLDRDLCLRSIHL